MTIHWDDPVPDDCTRVGNFITSVLQDAPGVESKHGTTQKGLFFKTGSTDLDKIDSIFLDNNIKVCNLADTDTDGIKKGRFRRLRIKKPTIIAFDEFYIDGNTTYLDNLTDPFLDFPIITHCTHLNLVLSGSAFVWNHPQFDSRYKFWRVVQHMDIDGSRTDTIVFNGVIDPMTGYLIGAPDSFSGQALDVQVQHPAPPFERRLIQYGLQVSSDNIHWPTLTPLLPINPLHIAPQDSANLPNPC